MEKEAEIIQLTYKHIDECIEMERNYGGMKETKELFSNQTKITDGIASHSQTFEITSKYFNELIINSFGNIQKIFKLVKLQFKDFRTLTIQSFNFFEKMTPSLYTTHKNIPFLFDFGVHSIKMCIEFHPRIEFVL
jgi:hypothetical protein